MTNYEDKAMDWLAEMALAGVDVESIGEFIVGIPDPDLKEAVARIHFAYTGEKLLDQ